MFVRYFTFLLSISFGLTSSAFAAQTNKVCRQVKGPYSATLDRQLDNLEIKENDQALPSGTLRFKIELPTGELVYDNPTAGESGFVARYEDGNKKVLLYNYVSGHPKLIGTLICP
jgi:hypothetical protein